MGLQKDYIQINYAGNDKVYIPVEKISSIYKYANKNDANPKINKLNSTTWEKTKRNLRKRINDISQQLILLYAQRKQTKNTKYKDYTI